MIVNLNDISNLLNRREKIFNYVLSGMTIGGAVGVLFADGTTAKNLSTIAAGIPAGIKVFKELNKETDEETEDLVDEVFKQQSVLVYRLDNLDARFGMNPTEKDFENPENIAYLIYVFENELNALQSSFYYIQNKYNKLINSKKHKKVYESIQKKKSR
ncbi:MAG: hypothetical protein IPO21_06095 [Bacteroidales bacterium]|nr:hypothetical protein [Bacteroidales bacterium]